MSVGDGADGPNRWGGSPGSLHTGGKRGQVKA